MRPPVKTPDRAPGVVDANSIYTLKEVCARLNWKADAWAQAKRAGLKVVRFGRTAYVRGSDLADFFARLIEKQEGGDV